jgi:hypothetical protein
MARTRPFPAPKVELGLWDQEDVALNAPVTGPAVDASLLDKSASKQVLSAAT